MFSLKEGFFEIQLIVNIFMATAVVILILLYLKLSAAKKKNPIIEKIEYLCKNLKVLLEESEKTSENIETKVEEFKMLYDKNIVEVENKISVLNGLIDKIESNKDISGELKELDIHKKVRNLLNEGYSVDEVCKMLKISKGEVELICKLKG